MASDEPRNIRYTIYDKATGEIIRAGVAGNAWSLNWRIEPGQGVILDQQADGRTHRVELIGEAPSIVQRDDIQPIEG